MFVLSQSPKFLWPVEFTAPEDGKQVKVRFRAEFKRPSDSEIRELFEEQGEFRADPGGKEARDRLLREEFDAIARELAESSALAESRLDELFERLLGAVDAVPNAQDLLNRRIKELRDWHETIVRRYMTGWKDIGGEGDKGDKDADFDAENLGRLLDVLGARPAIAMAFLDAIGGKAAEKNSKRPLAAG